MPCARLHAGACALVLARTPTRAPTRRRGHQHQPNMLAELQNCVRLYADSPSHSRASIHAWEQDCVSSERSQRQTEANAPSRACVHVRSHALVLTGSGTGSANEKQ
eukprot:6182084-Pleurochrysis_carterae.AAC.4